MKNVFFSVLMTLVFTGMMSCASSNKLSVQQLDGKWNITEVNGKEVTQKEKVPFIEFNLTENRVHGNAGCNMFNSSIVRDSKDLSAFKLSQAASTMMACPNMELEGEIMKTFESITGLKQGSSEKEVLLVNGEGKTLLVLSK